MIVDHKKFLGLIFLALAMARASHAENLYRYQITSYPKSLIGCLETSQAIAQSFFEYTGKTVYRVHCDQEDSVTYGISIDYLSEVPLDLVSTTNERTGGLGDLGIYRTLDECNQNLPQEIDWFERNTELPHLIAYCSREFGTGQSSYFPRIDSFGTAKRYPARYEGFVSGPVLDHAGFITQELFEKTELAGIAATTVHFQKNGNNQVVIRYYDLPENALHQLYYFSTDEVARFFSYSKNGAFENCHAEMVQAKKAYGDPFNEHAVWFCTGSPSEFRSNLHVFRITPFTRFAPTSELAPDQYKDFSECTTNKAKVVSFYETQLKKNVLGAICTFEDSILEKDHYKLRLFIKRPGGDL